MLKKNLLGRHSPLIGERYLVRLNTAKLALVMEEEALMREMEGNDHIVLERRLEIIQNKQRVNARDVGNNALSDRGSGLTYNQLNCRGVTNGYAFRTVTVQRVELTILGIQPLTNG